MKKLATLFLALALCMGLAVPAFAASMNSDKAAYDVSNQSTGTWEFEYKYMDWSDEEGAMVDVTETYTVNLVPAGTIVKATGGYQLSVTTYLEEGGSWEGFPGFDHPASVTIEDGGQVYHIQSIDPSSIDPEVISWVSTVDEGIWLKAGGSAPTTPTEPEKPGTPVEPTPPTQPL